MKRDVRSTVLALATFGLVAAGSVGCSAQGMFTAVSSEEPAQTDANSGTEEGTPNTEPDADSDQDASAPAAPEAPAEGGDEAAEGTEGFTGSAEGELEYVAPGEYIVDGTAFYVAESTQITAGIYACADGVQDPDTGDVTCDFDEFDATLANGNVVLASVEIVDGIAESITEYE
ncbi:hypothetical protein ACFOVU_19930 [Nocardiopsis sediminis]|uniref:Lipoprotein n=1 Tax=Nocardiopsis sediminis TaxID=1778267 RepID=A0ABV8FU51_9ACTN